MSIILDGSGAPSTGGKPPSKGPAIKESDTAHFAEDVIDASFEAPVIVDFWATWCGPCKTLGPLLEKLVRQAAGAVRLVKIDVDKNQDLALQFRVQSIPTVYAFKGGQPVDGFQGALPESQLKQFIARLTGGKGNVVDDLLAQAQALLDAGEAEEAAAIFQEVLAEDQGNAKAVAGILRCYLKVGQPETARQVIGQIPEDLQRHPDIAAAITAVEVAEQAQSVDTSAVAGLRNALEANPADHQARFDLATALHAAGDRDGAVDELLEIVRRNRGWNEEAARKQLVKLFEAFGPTDPLTVSARRRLSSILFS